MEQVTPDGIFLDLGAMRSAGISLDDVARFVGDYRYGDGLPQDADASAIPQEQLDARVFAAAIPGPALGGLTPHDIRELGPGEFGTEGDLVTPPRRIGGFVVPRD